MLYVGILCSASVSACVPALPAECDSCSYVAGLIQNSAALEESPTTTPAASQGEACLLNAGSASISAAEPSFEIVSIPNPGGADGAQTIVTDYDSIYIGGYQTMTPGDAAWRIEKRSRITGLLDTAFGTGGAILSNPGAQFDLINKMAIDATGLYVVGQDRSPGATNAQWRIEKRDRTTGALIPAFGVGGIVTEDISVRDDVPNGVAVDDSGLYIVGSRSVGVGNSEWRLEKRDLSTGNLIAAFGVVC
ncbi:MAG: hypothetical protein RIF32_09055 [Leptospirales bacterium]